jgi:hypothetical protein
MLKTWFNEMFVMFNTQVWLDFIANLIGILGSVFILLAYYAIENGKYTRDDYAYYLINLIGAVLLVISLLVNFNLGSFVIELFWILISLQGMMRLLKIKNINSMKYGKGK